MVLLFETDLSALPLWVKVVIALLTAFAGLSTLTLGLVGFYFYRNKNKGEGMKALAEGEAAEIHTSIQRSEFERQIEENEIKQVVMPVEYIQKLVELNQKNSQEITRMLDEGVELRTALSNSTTLVEQQKEIINRQHGIIENVHNRYETAIIRLGKEQDGHKDCLKKVEEMENEFNRKYNGLHREFEEFKLQMQGS